MLKAIVWILDKLIVWLITSAWTSPATYTSGQLITAADLNLISANLNALKAPPDDFFEDFSYAQSLNLGSSFANVNATDLNLDITTTGGDVMINVSGWFDSSASESATFLWFDVTKDGTRMGDTTNGMWKWEVENVDAVPFHFTYRVRSLAAGTYNFKLQAKETTATSTLTLDAIFFEAREAS